MALLDIHEIKNYLPHRYPFLLVDRVIEAVPEEKLVALKNVTYNEPFFEGHFPSCLLYTSPSPRDQRGSRMPSSA